MINEPESSEALAWAELKRRGSVRPQYLLGLEEEIAAELARCFDPYIFEQKIRPYGAIVVTLMVSVIQNVRALYRAEPLPGLAQAGR